MRAWPLCGKRAFNRSADWGARFSTVLMARARARESPERKRSIHGWRSGFKLFSVKQERRGWETGAIGKLPPEWSKGGISGLMSRMKTAPLLLSFALICSSLSGPSLYSQKQEERTDCIPFFKAEWCQGEGETVDKVTACANGELIASHTFTAPAFGSTSAEPTTWHYQGRLEKNAVVDLNKILHRKDISGLASKIDLGVKGVPNFVLHEQDQVARFSVSHEKTAQTITLKNIPGISCGEKPAQVEEAVWDLLCLYNYLYTRAKGGNDSSVGDCGCKSLKDMAESNSQ